MGLAASQARFLGLTARKSNIEYEGQQVNQQRTALAEEVNAQKDSLPELPIDMKRELLDMMEEQLKNGGEGSTEALSEIRQLRAELDAQEANRNIIAELKAAMKKSFPRTWCTDAA